MKKTFTTSLQKFQSDLWGFHLPVPESIATQFIDGNDRRIKCVVNGVLPLQCALMPDNGQYFILMNKPNIKKTGLQIGDPVQVEIEKDHSEYGLDMPASFYALLSQDEEGAGLFHALTMGKQRSLIYIVGKVKSIDSQINKGLAILDHLKTQQGKLDFKLLNEAIKRYNQRNKLS